MASVRAQAFHEYKNPSQSLAGQARRRQDALERQRQQRTQAFSLTREGLDSIIDDLDLSDDEANETVVSDKATLDGNNDEMQAEPAPSGETSHKKLPKKIKNKWKAYADKLMQGESLNIEEGLPSDFFEEWIAVGPVPKGKRCLVVTFRQARTTRQGRVTNTLLLARVSGRPLSRHWVPALPPDCVLDCVYSPTHAALFVLDILRWKGQSIADSEAEFRMFWRDSKLSEVGPQPLPSVFMTETTSESTMEEATSKKQKPPQLVVLPVPALPAPLQPRQLYDYIATIMGQGDKGNLVFAGLVGDFSNQQGQQVPLSYDVEGMTLLVKSARYESGLTPLAAWIGLKELPAFLMLIASRGLDSS